MANEDLRMFFKEKQVRQWEVADLLGYNESVMVKHLRYEFPEEIKQRIYLCINEFLQGKTPDTSFYTAYIAKRSKKLHEENMKRRRTPDSSYINNYANKIIKDVAFIEEMRRYL